MAYIDSYGVEYSDDRNTLVKCPKSVKALYIPSNIRQISEYAFTDCAELEEVTVEEANQFFSSSNGVLFNKEKTLLLFLPRNWAGCYVIPESVVQVLPFAINNCKLLESIVVSKTVEKVGENDYACPFGRCEKLSKIIVENNPNYFSIEGALYDYSKTVLIRCPQGKSGSFIIPNGVNEIRHSAFSSCKLLSNVHIPDSVIIIGKRAFDGCNSLESLIIPKSTAEIGDFSFPNSLKTIYSDENGHFVSDGRILIDKSKSSIKYVCKNITGDVIVPEGIMLIEIGAFADCENLSSVVFPSSLRKIQRSAFHHCHSLTSVRFNTDVEDIGMFAFGDCERLTSITIPKNLHGIWGFAVENLNSVALSDGAEVIGKDMFKGCLKVTDITIPASVKTVEANALDDCKALKNIHYEGTLKEWLAMKWPCVVKSGYNLYIQGKLLTDVALDGSVSEIRENAFYYCNSLQHVEIREGVEKIGASAFNKTSIIGDVYLPDSVKSIGEYAFLSCKNLKSISIPHNSWGIGIGSGVFRYCDALEKVDIRGKNEGEWDEVYSIDGVVFSKNHIHFDGSTQDGGHWFKNVWSVSLYHYPCGRKATKYIIPIDVQSIEDYAFTGVTNLTIVFRKYVYCEKNTFLNAKIRIQIPIGTIQKFIDGGYPKETLQEIDVERYLDRGKIDERCFELVSHNPYRMLGVFADATLKEITANKTKSARYSSVGKTVSFDADLDALLSPMNRTAEGIEKAFADLSLPQDKIKYALTWFVKGGSIEGIALDHIKSGNYDKAFEILQKKETWSSLLNQGALSLARKDVEGAVASITKLIHEEDYRNSFAASIGGEAFTINEDELAHSFIDMLMAGNESPALLDIFEQNGEAAEDDVYIRKKLTDAPVSRIKAAITKAKGVNPDDSTASYLAGKTLMDDTKEDLAKLRGICGEDTIYSMTADSLAKQILQCGINYYNESLDDQYERIDKAMELQKYALDIAEGSIAKGRCKENVDILLNIQNNLPPKEIKSSVDSIYKLLDNFKKDEGKHHSLFFGILNTPTGAIQLIKDCVPHLMAIKEKVGAKNEFYLSISTLVANIALSSAIDAVNSTQDKQIHSSAFASYNMLDIKNTLTYAWMTMLYIRTLQLEPDFRGGRFKENFDILKGIIERLHGFSGTGTTRDFVVFGKSLFVDLDLRTETECFNCCTNPAGCRYYMEKFPTGKYFTQVKQKYFDLQEKSWSNCKSLEDYKKHRKEFPHGFHELEAIEKIEQIEEDLLWATTKHLDTIESYNNYISQTKLSQHKSDAQSAIERIQNAKRKRKLIMVAIGLGIGIMITLITLLK